MCGIAGFFGKCSIDTRDLLLRLNRAQQHRGPDGAGMWLEDERRAGLAHRRLAVVDLSETGAQPMHSRSGRYIVTYNGEIYNFLELRSELLGKGHRFIGTSDTEVMLAAFEEWGVAESVSRFNGMFAVAVWDRKQRTGFLFRDRLGVKPLYYQWHAGALFFSSELTPPFARITPRSISRECLALFLQYGYVPGQRSIYEGISKLKPGVIAMVSEMSAAAGALESSIVYWDTTKKINERLESQNEQLSEDEAVELVNVALSHSVRQRMIADVPLGAFLSGGIDSSLIVAHMQQASTRPVRTFTIGFDDTSANEAPFAKKIADHLGTEHTELYVTEQDALNVIPSLPHIYGEPFADSSQIPTFLVSKLTRSSVTVALSGDGGDELFAGYADYMTVQKHQRLLKRLPNFSLRALASLLSSSGGQRVFCSVLGERDFTRIANAANLFSSREASQLLSTRLLVKDCGPISTDGTSRNCAGDMIEQTMCRDLNAYLPDDILVKVDRASMAVALETRSPFVDDFQVFEMAWSIPLRHKIRHHGGKLILKRALESFLPKDLFERPKKGFAVPLHLWLFGELKDWVSDCVSTSRLAREGYLVPSRVEFIRKQAASGDLFYNTRLWSICMFQSWLDEAGEASVAKAA